MAERSVATESRGLHWLSPPADDLSSIVDAFSTSQRDPGLGCNQIVQILNLVVLPDRSMNIEQPGTDTRPSHYDALIVGIDRVVEPSTQPRQIFDQCVRPVAGIDDVVSISRRETECSPPLYSAVVQ